MAKIKTVFALLDQMESVTGNIEIVTEYGKSNTCVMITVKGKRQWVKEEDTERFAVNILKALKSKHLK